MKHTPPDSSHTLLSPWPARSGAFFWGGDGAAEAAPRISFPTGNEAVSPERLLQKLESAVLELGSGRPTRP